MNAEMERHLDLARTHDLARERAHALRREAIAGFWAQVGAAMAGAAKRHSRRLWQRLQRHRAGGAGPADAPAA